MNEPSSIEWMKYFRVISSGNLLCLLCEVAVSVDGGGVWDSEKANWIERDATLATFAFGAAGHMVECTVFNGLIR